MDESGFWRLIESAQTEAGDPDGYAERGMEILRRKVEQLPVEELLAFARIFNSKYLDAYTHDLWAAAYIINGGCSDDGFMDFRGALVARGEAVYREALRDAQTLAEVDPPVFPDEGWTYVPAQAYRAKTGESLPKSTYGRHPSEPAGVRWEEDTVGEKVPRLAEKFGYQG